MQKLILNVAAILMFIALVILAQAPDGGAPAFKGPDAVAANLVNNACAACHSLDRVKNKMADKDGWTTTVARMKDKGADLTDEQVPVVVEFLTRAAGTLTVAAGDGKGGKGGKGGGGKAGKAGKAANFAPKNLKVLDANALPQIMQNFVASLGLMDKGGCSFCHVADRASDEKMTKVTARNMAIMVKEINARFPDGKQHVNCYTCHRGSTEPLTAP